jgi:hypothetical protein
VRDVDKHEASFSHGRSCFRIRSKHVSRIDRTVVQFIPELGFSLSITEQLRKRNSKGNTNHHCRCSDGEGGGGKFDCHDSRPSRQGLFYSRDLAVGGRLAENHELSRFSHMCNQETTGEIDQEIASILVAFELLRIGHGSGSLSSVMSFRSKARANSTSQRGSWDGPS